MLWPDPASKRHPCPFGGNTRADIDQGKNRKEINHFTTCAIAFIVWFLKYPRGLIYAVKTV